MLIQKALFFYCKGFVINLVYHILNEPQVLWITIYCFHKGTHCNLVMICKCIENTSLESDINWALLTHKKGGFCERKREKKLEFDFLSFGE